MTIRIRINGSEEATGAATVAELLRARGIEGRRGVAVAVNGVVVPAGAWPDRRLGPDDAIEIVRPFGGG
jgi:sulfur carrier protein